MASDFDWHFRMAIRVFKWTGITALVVILVLLLTLLYRDVFPAEPRNVWINRCDGLGHMYTATEAATLITPCFDYRNYPPHPRKKP